MKYLTKEVRSKIVPKKRFNIVFGPIIRELGKLSRASRLYRLFDEGFVKTASAEKDRKRSLRSLFLFNTMKLATN